MAFGGLLRLKRFTEAFAPGKAGAVVKGYEGGLAACETMTGLC
jgi:hypothetical protein